jgi:hypothetical protein
VSDLPAYLLRQRDARESEIDRSRLCSCVNDEHQVNAECRICVGAPAFSPSPTTSNLGRMRSGRSGNEPIPAGHPALENEQWIPGMGGSGPRR